MPTQYFRMNFKDKRYLDLLKIVVSGSYDFFVRLLRHGEIKTQQYLN